MSINLSIISGKGGCGKTTLALSLSQLLASSGAKVLLIDCDTSTHGATYFFESMLLEKSKILTMTDIFSLEVKDYLETKRILNVRRNIDFIPSCVNLTNDAYGDVKLDFSMDEEKQKLLELYDIVIFDCQAGYTKITEKVIELSSEVLVVLETDSITSSSTRVLSAQLADKLHSGNTYQVFNKVAKEDFNLYRLLTHGTFFTNLTPIQYDLSVKKAFAINDLPKIDIENTVFSNNIFELAYSLFPTRRNELHNSIVILKRKIRNHLQNELDLLFNNRERENKKRKIESIFLLILSIVCIIPTCWFIPESYRYLGLLHILTLVGCGMLLSVSIFLMINLIRKLSKNNLNDSDNEKRMHEFIKRIEALSEQIGDDYDPWDVDED